MDTTAKEIGTWIKYRIDGLIESGRFNSARVVYDKLASDAGLSPSMVRLFHKGVNDNPSGDALDKLVTAIKADQRLHI